MFVAAALHRLLTSDSHLLQRCNTAAYNAAPMPESIITMPYLSALLLQGCNSAACNAVPMPECTTTMSYQPALLLLQL